jgi:3-deoxy-D-manno-octulosonic-acid transferase
VVLWDTIGELAPAYARARAAFVGGSLAPLGGQNFIEALTAGVIPVVGPSWEDFRWVGDALFKSGLARIGADWRAVADQLMDDLAHPLPRRQVQSMARDYITRRQGGAAAACRRVTAGLSMPRQAGRCRGPQTRAARFSR